mgnify:FL=1
MCIWVNMCIGLTCIWINMCIGLTCVFMKVGVKQEKGVCTFLYCRTWTTFSHALSNICSPKLLFKYSSCHNQHLNLFWSQTKINPTSVSQKIWFHYFTHLTCSKSWTWERWEESQTFTHFTCNKSWTGERWEESQTFTHFTCNNSWTGEWWEESQTFNNVSKEHGGKSHQPWKSLIRYKIELQIPSWRLTSRTVADANLSGKLMGNVWDVGKHYDSFHDLYDLYIMVGRPINDPQRSSPTITYKCHNNIVSLNVASIAIRIALDCFSVVVLECSLYFNTTVWLMVVCSWM